MEVRIIIWILIVITEHCGQCCTPAEIGQEYTIVSRASVPSGAPVMWGVLIRNGVVIYDSAESEPNLYSNQYIGSKTQLTIKNVTKIDGTVPFVHVVYGYKVIYNCTLPVYKKASIPTCESVTLTGNQLRTKCATTEVFPEAKCQFTLHNGEGDKRDITYDTSFITYNHTDPQNGRYDYYSTSCTLQYPVDGLKPGNWTVQVNMHPNQTGVSSAQGTVGQADNILMLSLPSISIDFNNCPKGLADEDDTNVRQGYIRQGETASCLCTLDHVGNPPGAVDWSSTHGGNFSYLSHRSSTDVATIEIKSPGILCGTYTCQSISVLDGSPHSESYTPTYAYGPSSSLITFQRSGPIYLCPNQQTNVDITCQVPAHSFNPAVLFTIRDGNSNSLVTKAAGDTPLSISVNYNFTKSGKHAFLCRAENAIFSDIFTDASVSAIQVYAPPNSPPSFQVKGLSVAKDESETWVEQGSDIYVSCFADEAYPVVNSVTVTCGRENSSSGQLFVSAVSDDELACQCSVDHETNTPCNGLNLNEEITVQTAFGPNEVTLSFTDDQLREVQNEPLNLCRSEGLDLTVICAVSQSDVRPRLTNHSFSLTKPETFVITQQSYLNASGTGEFRSVNKLRVIYGGNNTLVCEAKNPKFSDLKKTQSVTFDVRVPPKDPPKMSARSSQHDYVLMEGDDVTVTCDVSGGYPSVQSVILTCGQDQGVISNGKTAELTLIEIGLRYNETKCICQATHITECYDLTNVLYLTLLPNNATKARVNEYETPNTTVQLAVTAIGSVVGTLVLVAAIALIVIFIRREKAKRQKRNKDTEYDEIEKPRRAQRYQNVKLPDPNYLAINSSGQTHGPSRESAIRKTEHIYNNQVFGDNTETAETDLDAYSYIKD